jgi:hypothetical protein
MSCEEMVSSVKKYYTSIHQHRMERERKREIEETQYVRDASEVCLGYKSETSSVQVFI